MCFYYTPYFMWDSPNENDKEVFGAKYCAVMRFPGYTCGHVLLDDNFKIINIKIYERNCNRFVVSGPEAEQKLVDAFLGKEFEHE